MLPWPDYFWGVPLRAYRKFEQRVGVIEHGRGAKGNRVRTEILRRNQPFALTDIERGCPGVSRDMIRHVLRQPKNEGHIQAVGRGPNAKWASMASDPDA